MNPKPIKTERLASSSVFNKCSSDAIAANGMVERTRKVRSKVRILPSQTIRKIGRAYRRRRGKISPFTVQVLDPHSSK